VSGPFVFLRGEWHYLYPFLKKKKKVGDIASDMSPAVLYPTIYGGQKVEQLTPWCKNPILTFFFLLETPKKTTHES
jgi:hypothetical protein